MIDFKDKKEILLSKEFKNKGYLKVQTDSELSLQYLREKIVKNTCKILKIDVPPVKSYDYFLNNFNKKIKLKDLNNIRVQIIEHLIKIKTIENIIFLLQKIFYMD